MKIITNEKLIKRNRKIGQILTGASLIILAIGLVISFSKPELILVSWGSLIFGFLLSQVGIYFGNRYGKSPRPDEILSTNLKGLDDRYTLYHYSSPVPHLLVAPNSVWALLPYAQKGKISTQHGRYRHTGGNFLMKFFGQEGLGNPIKDAQDQTREINNSLRKAFPEGELPPVNAAVVFTSDDVVLDIEEAPLPTISAKKLKELIRKGAKVNPIPADKMEKIQEAMDRGVKVI